MAAAAQRADLLVASCPPPASAIPDTCRRTLCGRKRRPCLEVLILAVHALFHALEQQAAGVACEQLIPIAAPKHLDHVPAGAAEDAFELLNDAAVAAHRAVQPLQIAVDDEDQVVELFARGNVQRAGRFGLIHLAIATETRRPCDRFLAGGRGFPDSARKRAW